MTLTAPIKIRFLDAKPYYVVGDELTTFIDVDSSGQFDSIDIMFVCVTRIAKFVKGKDRIESSAKNRKEKVHLSAVCNLREGNVNIGQASTAGGVITFQIKFKIPEGLPSSVESASGYTKYEIAVVVLKTVGDVAKRFVVCSSRIEVVSPINLNKFLYVSKRMNLKIEKNLNQCCRRRGKIIAIAQSPYSGYTPAQLMEITLTIFNQSSTRIVDTVIQFVQRVYYRITLQGFYRDERVVEHCNFGPVDVGNIKVFDYHLRFPTLLAPTSNRKVPDVDISYCIRVVLKLPNRQPKITGVYPIIIGTVDLNKFLTLPNANILKRMLRKSTRMRELGRGVQMEDRNEDIGAA